MLAHVDVRPDDLLPPGEPPRRRDDGLTRAGRGAEFTPSQRSLRARMAAYALHATHDPRQTTKAARAAFADRFERQVDPDRRLSPAERRRRAEAAKKAYFTALALKSSRARQRRAQP